MHEAIVAGAPGHPLGGGVLAAVAVGDQQLDLAADEGLVLLPGDVVDDVTSRSYLAWTTSCGTCSAIDAAGVPGRCEYWNVNAPLNRACTDDVERLRRSRPRTRRGSRR